MIVQKSSVLDEIFHQILTSKNSRQSKIESINPSRFKVKVVGG